MADGRKNNGGARPGAGRKKRGDELKAAELFSNAGTEAVKFIEGLISDETANTRDRLAAAKIAVEYKLGKPQDRIEITTDENDKPQFVFIDKRKGKK